MKFTTSTIILASLLALTTACTKNDSSSNKASQEAGQGKVTVTESVPSLTITTEKQGDVEVKTVALSFPLGGEQSSVYKGELKADGESSLRSEDESSTDLSSVTALTFGTGVELVVAVRDTPTDAQGNVSTAFLFVKNEDGTYSYLSREDNSTVSQVREKYEKLAGDDAKFQAWYQDALKTLKGATPEAPATPETPNEQEQEQQAPVAPVEQPKK